jgi:two-component system, OmpR family, KDP operon response regulator KdpE
MVVANNGAFRRFLRTYLAVRSHRCVEASGLAEAARVVRLSLPGLVLLDLGVGDGDVREFTERVRAETRARVLVLGDREDTVTIVRCLDAGASDFIKKPFAAADLTNRLDLVLADSATADPAAVIRTGPLVVDFEHREVRVATRPIVLTRSEYGVLAAVVRRVGHVVTLRQLAQEILGDPAARSPEVIRRIMMTLRMKIERDPVRPSLLLCETGIGYRVMMHSGEEPGEEAPVNACEDWR